MAERDPSGRETVADRVERKLAELGLKPRTVSVDVTGGTDPDLIRDISRRGRVPKGDAMARLAAALGTTQEWLLYGGDEAEWRRRLETANPRVLTEVAGGRVTERRPAYDPWDRSQWIPRVGGAIGDVRDVLDLDEHIELTELDYGDVLEWVARPPELQGDPDAYELTVIGESMVPLFKSGTRVMVSPRAEVLIGDNVIVQLKGREGADERVKMVLIKELTARSASFIELRQHKPEITFQVPRSRLAVDARGRPLIHKVVLARFG